MPYVSETRFRVRYAETDQMGMVYYANYLIWMEVGRTDFCRECGFTYHELEQGERAYLTVAEADCRYMVPARYDDAIVVETELVRAGSRIVEFSYKIKSDAVLLARGRTVHVVIGADGKPRSMPARYVDLLKSKIH
jgi:acyl-CoA thioester hydrolase